MEKSDQYQDEVIIEITDCTQSVDNIVNEGPFEPLQSLAPSDLRTRIVPDDCPSAGHRVTGDASAPQRYAQVPPNTDPGGPAGPRRHRTKHRADVVWGQSVHSSVHQLRLAVLNALRQWQPAQLSHQGCTGG